MLCLARAKKRIKQLTKNWFCDKVALTASFDGGTMQV